MLVILIDMVQEFYFKAKLKDRGKTNHYVSLRAKIRGTVDVCINPPLNRSVLNL